MATSQPRKGLALAGLLWNMLDLSHAGCFNSRVGEYPVVSLGGANPRANTFGRRALRCTHLSCERIDRSRRRSLSGWVRQTRCDMVQRCQTAAAEKPCSSPAPSTNSQGTPNTDHDKNHVGNHRESHHHHSDACDPEGRGCSARAEPHPNRIHPFIGTAAAIAATL